eukprot:TRINITY_DN8740_c0_g1_i1.p1 TRINITY_DN8740_c0_g1~~TRINITY_DN8740_c0_g1_i1.p1  ORF type:complete len:361 (-),score=17.43 TRINITY_DN8740_c0_g1_i1:547-1629(-)
MRMTCLAESFLAVVWIAILICLLLQISEDVKKDSREQRLADKSDNIHQVSYLFLNTSSQVFGLQKKEETPHLLSWHPKYEDARQEAINEWMHFGGIGIQPPIQDRFPCSAFVSHEYRFIFVKQLMTQSEEFFFKVLGGECNYDNGVKKEGFCVHRMTYLREEEAEQVWKEYFVFTVVRNPWIRAMSTYQMLQRSGFLNATDKSCRTKRETFCQHPYSIGATCESKPHCCEQHVDNIITTLHRQMTCLQSFDGRLTIDFIARTENLESDLNRAIDIINEEYRKSSVPKLRYLQEAQVIQEENESIESLGFHSNDRCIKDLAWHYQDDLNFLGLNHVLDPQFTSSSLPQKQNELISLISHFK